MGGMGGMMVAAATQPEKSRARPTGQGNHLLPTTPIVSRTADGKTHAFWERNCASRPTPPGRAGKRYARDHAGRDDGRQGFGDFRRGRRSSRR